MPVQQVQNKSWSNFYNCEFQGLWALCYIKSFTFFLQFGLDPRLFERSQFKKRDASNLQLHYNLSPGQKLSYKPFDEMADGKVTTFAALRLNRNHDQLQ